MPKYNGKDFSENGRRSTQHSSGGSTQHANNSLRRARVSNRKQEAAFSRDSEVRSHREDTKVDKWQQKKKKY